jgi:hypothetical protein
MTPVPELVKLLAAYERGTYSTIDLIDRIISVSTDDNMVAILHQLPDDIKEQLRRMSKEFDPAEIYYDALGNRRPENPEILLKYKQMFSQRDLGS